MSDLDAAGPATDAQPDGFTPVEAPSISLPQGGGAIRGIGEKLAVNPATGTAAVRHADRCRLSQQGVNPLRSLWSGVD